MRGRTVKWIAAGALAVVAFEIALRVLWPRIDDNDSFPTLEQQLAVLAALALLALPHVIAVLGYRGRPALLRVAGVVALLLGIATLLPVTTALVGIPLLLVPSFFYFVASRGAGRSRRVPTAVLAAVAGVCALAGAAAFFATEDPRCEMTRKAPGGGVSVSQVLCAPDDGMAVLGVDDVSYSFTSDVVTFRESLASLALSLGALAFCAWGSAATRQRHTPA